MYSKAVRSWLIVGCILLFFQVVIGGITRITGSGLSITEWDIVFGTFPPMNADSWLIEFDKYKATPQYDKLNEGMSLSEFKFIYFWEYFHRLWARIMGFIFLIPAVLFTLGKSLDGKLWRKLYPMIGFAALAAVFGWIMVASGLIERPWVNAYKLSIHLSIAFITFAFLVRATLFSFSEKGETLVGRVPSFFVLLGIVLSIQIVFGGIMSGMRAGLIFPTWPDMSGAFIPSILTDGGNWSLHNLEYYDQSAFAPALIQFVHRMTAYLLTGLVGYGWYRQIRFTGRVSLWYKLFTGLIGLQVIIGILTVVSCKGSIPLGFGVLHQAIGLLLVGAYVGVLFILRRTSISDQVSAA